MGSKNIYGPDYKKPWLRRDFPHQRTHLGDHREHIVLFVCVFVTVVSALFFVLEWAA
jgi:hypothetical protein